MMAAVEKAREWPRVLVVDVIILRVLLCIHSRLAHAIRSETASSQRKKHFMLKKGHLFVCPGRFESDNCMWGPD